MIILEPGRLQRHYWRDVWRYRELFVILAWRDLSVRYKQTAIGVVWAIIKALVTVAIFTFVFGRIAKLPTGSLAPYTLVVFAGMIPWSLFSNILGQASASVVGNSNLIGKVYFPRLIVPAAPAISSLVDALIWLPLLFGMMLWFGFWPDVRIALLPLFMLLTVLISVGPTLLFAALNVKYRDSQFIAAYLIQFGLYVSPVGFSSAAIPAQWRPLYSLNPMVGVIDGFRWCVLHGEPKLYYPSLMISISAAILMLWIGIAYFRKVENRFADII
ncbi:MAG TPA: ABC transporter permease [Micropepsaceae bacterium]|nr:ABC transporter permease [Micropepsaceae bacterium]